MSFKNCFKLIFLTIITCGLIWFFIKRKKQQNVQLSQTNKHGFKLAQLATKLGGWKNIRNVTATHTKIKVILTSTQVVKPTTFQNMKGISGVLITSQTVTLIVGNKAQSLAAAMKQKITT